jgi:hypothetical protein
MILHDSVTVSAPRRTRDGYLVADAAVARTGIQEYLGSELGKPELGIVRVFRPEDSVFAADAMLSYAFRPMTNNHPREPVTADNWRAVAIGQTGGDVVRDGDHVRVPLVLMDASAIADYESGKRELSMGYESEIVFQDGVTPDGQQYDAIQTRMRMNHLALVDRARGGAALRIGDDEQRQSRREPSQMEIPMADTKTRTILVDGLQVETTDAGAQAIEKLQGQITASAQQLADANTAHQAALADRDAKLAKAEAERDAFAAKVLTDAQIDARVKARADLIATANLIADGDYSGKSEDEIRRAAVVAKLGDAAVKDKPEAYVAARFDILAEDAAKADPVRAALQTRDGTVRNTQDNGQTAYESRLQNAWKGDQPKGVN